MNLRLLVNRHSGQVIKGYLSRSMAACQNRVLPDDRTSYQTVQRQFAAKYSDEASNTIQEASATIQQSFNIGLKKLLVLNPEGKVLTVTWKDGSQSQFDSVWLRHNCQCGDCRQGHSGQRLFHPASIPHNIVMDSVNNRGDLLEIRWLGEENHVGLLSLSYLQRNCYQSEALQDKRDAVKIKKPKKTIPEFDYSEFVKSSDGVFRWLKQINEEGLSLLKGVPISDGMVCKIAKHVGPVMHTIYGETFDVVSTPKPINVAYSSVGLDFHMDLIYYESPPGLQLLHCLRFDKCVEGGQSRFVDVFHVAEKFRKENPHRFFTLTHVPATFQKIHYERDIPVDMKYQRPHIVLNHLQEIVAVNWAPAFEGPLAVNQDDVLPYYDAYEAFAKEIQFSSNIVEFLMQPGDLVTFNNRRMLHGRKSFELNGGVRHLKGCYVNIDHFKNQVQVFSRLHGTGEPAKRVGNQDWF